MSERWLTFDPGESCGAAVWEDDKLIYADTMEMGYVDIMLHYAILANDEEYSDWIELHPEYSDFAEEVRGHDITLIICEDWKLYPWVMYTPDGRATHALDFDPCRTARLIGAITHVARLAGIPVELQGAKIKETAVAAGAENLYYHPLHENRHQNDAIQHGVYWLVVQENRAPKDARES